MGRKASKKKNRRSTADRNKAAREKRAREGKGFNYFKLPEDLKMFEPAFEKNEAEAIYYLDFLQYIVTNENHPDINDGADVDDPYGCLPIKTHKGIGANNATVLCPSTIGKKCPICKHFKALRDEEGYDAAADFKHFYREIYFVVPLNGEEEFPEKPHLFDISTHLFRKKLDKVTNRDNSLDDYDDNDDGRTMKVIFEKREYKTGKKTIEFPAADEISFKKRKADYSDIELPDLDKIFEDSLLSYKELEKMLLDIDEPEETEDTEPNENTESEDNETSNDNDCVACGGTGENSNGGTCKPCNGTGEKQIPLDEEPKKEETKKETKKEKVLREREERKAEKKKEKSESEENECPHGHKYGVDNENEDNEDDCTTCEVWEACYDKMQELKNE